VYGREKLEREAEAKWERFGQRFGKPQSEYQLFLRMEEGAKPVLLRFEKV
jgi:hypothetical protein